MFELLAGLALLQATANLEAVPGYTQDTLSGFIAIENARPVDGVDYSNGEGVASAGLLYAHPEGFFTGTEFLASQGDGSGMPQDAVFALRSFAGYARAFGPHRLAIELLDYRFDASTHRLAHQGVGMRYRFGSFQLEVAHERDKPYFYEYRQRFYRYDNSRLALGWEQRFKQDFSWSAGAGVSRIDGIELDYHFATLNLHWRAGRANWQMGVAWASKDLESFYGNDVDRRQFTLRVAVPFRIF